MDKKTDERSTVDVSSAMKSDSKQNSNKADTSAVNSVANEKNEESGEEKKEDEDEDEEEEEEEEDRIIEKSPTQRFHKRNKKYMRKVPGIDNSFIAIEPKSGKEVIWNEINMSDKTLEQEKWFVDLIKRLISFNHPFFVRYLDVWNPKPEKGTDRNQESAPTKVIFVTERLTDPTMKQYFVNSSSTHRLTNKALWRKFVGQMLSVLKFLDRMGVYHGNLSNETVYYQNTGCLKVGTLAVDLNFHSKPSNDIYDMGKLALEMAAYEAADDAENLGTPERIQKMLSRVTDHLQSSFIQTCLDHSESPTTLLKLFQHAALKEIPSLKRLAAKVIVQKSGRERTGKVFFDRLCDGFKDQMSHFEDETVLVKAVFIKENATKLRLWKEFRVHFTNAPKYIQDVKNGFYPIFEGNCSQYQDDGEIICTYSMEQDISRDAVVGGVSNKDSFLMTGFDVTFMADQDTHANDTLRHDTRMDDSTVLVTNATGPNTQASAIIDGKSDKNEKNAIALARTVSPEARIDTGGQSLADDARIDANYQGISMDTPAESYDDNIEDDDVDNDIDATEISQDHRTSRDTLAGVHMGTSSTGGSVIGTVGGQGCDQVYWDYVTPPEKPPSDRALFTGCHYSYIGCGRWQAYVQMWFLEDRLKREVIVQLTETEWARDSAVSGMFKDANIVPADDQAILERILAYARHNCPLIDGELVPPHHKLAHFDAYDLYQRLEHMQMFAKAKQLLERAEMNLTVDSPQRSLAVSPKAEKVPNPTQGQSRYHSPPGVGGGGGVVVGPIDDSKQSQGQSLQSRTTTTTTPVTPAEDKARILRGTKIGELPGFKLELLDIRILAPLNFSCMYCDNHDYLHSEDLPAYLSSPCYHCREALAREAKISPSALFDLHQQNFVPWPAFLQVRFNIPPVGTGGAHTKSLTELIEYDCKWRGRSPCRCLAAPASSSATTGAGTTAITTGAGGAGSPLLLPPCVEFPTLYGVGPEPVTGNTVPHNHHQPIIGDNSASGALNGRGHLNPEAMSDTTNRHSGKSVLPCSGRHSRGAQMTCVHGYTFPRLDQPPHQLPHQQHPVTTEQQQQGSPSPTMSPSPPPATGTSAAPVKRK